MSKKIFICVALVLMILPLASARDVELKIVSPSSGQKYTTNGEVTVSFTIENDENSPATATNVKLEADEKDLKFTSGSTSIEANETGTIDLTISGFIWTRTSVKVTVTASASGENVDEDSITIYLEPPYMDLEILSPDKEVVLLDKEPESSATIDVLIKNLGGIDLKGVGIKATGKSGTHCNTASTTKVISAGKTGKYKITCANITSGDSVELKVEDANGAAFDMETFRIRFAESFKVRELNITSPYENEELRFGEYGGVLEVDVKNVGDTKLDGVCAYLKGINYTNDSCADIDKGLNHIFKIPVFPKEETANVKIYVGDSGEYSNDIVGIRILKLDILDQNVTGTDQNQSGENVDNGTVGGDNVGVDGSEANTDQDSSGGNIMNTGLEYIIAVVIVFLLVVLGIVVKVKEKAK